MSGSPARALPLVIAGIGGRMGRAVAEASAGDARVRLAAGIERAGAAAAFAGTPVVASVPEAAAVVSAERAVLVEFCLAGGALEHARAAAALGWPVVSGSTGLEAGDEAALRALGARVAVVRSANFSRGAAALLETAAALRRCLGPAFEAEIVETHHRGKRDAPSGTALALAAALGATDLSGTLRVGRGRGASPRAEGEVVVHSLRAGDVVGEHRLLLAGPGETLEITHRVHARSAFAAGVIEAAVRAASAPPGVHAFEDLLREEGTT